MKFTFDVRNSETNELHRMVAAVEFKYANGETLVAEQDEEGNVEIPRGGIILAYRFVSPWINA